MISNILSLLKYSWNNAYKEKYFWLFVVLILIQSAIELLFVQSNTLLVSFLDLTKQALYLLILLSGYIGITYVAYRRAANTSPKLSEVFQIIKNSFKKSVVLFLLISLLFVPFLFLVVFLSFKQTNQASYSSHVIYSLVTFFSIFSFVWYFPLAEIVVNGSGVRKSIRTVRGLLSKHFFFLLILGGILTFISHTIGILTGAFAILIKSNFDFTSLRNLDLISPYLSFTDNRFYQFSSSVWQAIWGCYSIMVFAFAYLKFSEVNINTKNF